MISLYSAIRAPSASLAIRPLYEHNDQTLLVNEFFLLEKQFDHERGRESIPLFGVIVLLLANNLMWAVSTLHINFTVCISMGICNGGKCKAISDSALLGFRNQKSPSQFHEGILSETFECLKVFPYPLRSSIQQIC